MGQTIIAGLYSQQLVCVQQALLQKDPALVNCKGARPLVTLVVRDTVQRLGWESLCHLITLSSATQDNHLRGKFFTNETDLRQALRDFFESKLLVLPQRDSTAGDIGRKCWMPITFNE
ncbi:hypothetical protein NPIL_441491 [Nephila pilipes]|uniref:Uncharacterized protein n=1 Tax=Nephila pilipes TaxID=299642 RepID=A0A8X6QFI0_NEPPI|nr:hypothetical protein NPIL_441491 [Nephila pilipes]